MINTPIYNEPSYQTYLENPLTQLQTQIELPPNPPTEQKDRRRGLDTKNKVKAYRPVLVTDNGIVIRGKPFETSFGAESETMYALDELPYNQGYVEEVIVDPEEVRRSRQYRKTGKFIKQNGLIIEKRYARFDNPKERKQGNFNIMPYVFGYN